MRIIPDNEIAQGSAEWLALREARITGTKLGKCYAKSRSDDELYDTNKRLLGFYELVAEMLADSDTDGQSSSRERGHELEAEAVDELEKITGQTYARGGVWLVNDWHMESPDAYTPDLTEAVEVKCLASARHIMAIDTDTPPQEYMGEYLNYFVANKDLQKLHICLYDPRFYDERLRLHYWTITRDEWASKITRAENIAGHIKNDVERVVARLTSDKAQQ